MEITNAKTAHEWLRSWDGKPRRGIATAAIEGLGTSAAICRSSGRLMMAADYTAAAEVIERATK